MGFAIFLLKWTTYITVFCFATVCLATGLYYIAEFVEQYERTTKKVIKYTIWGILGAHLLIFFFEDIPFHLFMIGIISHLVYWYMLKLFPNIRMSSVPFVMGAVCFLVSQFFWFQFLRSRYLPFEEVCAYFLMLVWLVPFIFFVSITTNENVLPYGSTISATGAPVIGEAKGRTNFVRNLFQTVIQFGRQDSSPLDTRPRYR